MARSRNEAQKGIQVSPAWLYTHRGHERPSRDQRGISEAVLETRLGGTGAPVNPKLGRGDRDGAHRQDLSPGFQRKPKYTKVRWTHRPLPSFKQCVRNLN